MQPGRRTWYQRRGKRILDCSLALAGAIVLSPFLLLIALLVRLRIGSPVLFRQARGGLHGRPFEILKFRTMTDARAPRGALLPDSSRLTPLGRFLRAASLDELPELWNVWRGEMSFVGPRPLVVRYDPYFTAAERARFTVRPGITGAAQIAGRNDLSWDSRIAADLRYVDQLSFLLDLKILWATLRKVYTSEGCRADTSAGLDFDQERIGRGARRP